MRRLAFALVLLLAPAAHADTRTIARCGEGYLEEVDGTKVLHLKGSPYAMGLQQGTLLRDDIRELVRFLFDVKAKELKLDFLGVKPDIRAIIGMIADGQRRFVPERFHEELRGVADGCGLGCSGGPPLTAS